MLKNRAIQVRMVREDAPPTGRPQVGQSEWTPVTVSALIQEQIQNILITGAMVYVVKVTADTFGAILLKKTKPRK